MADHVNAEAAQQANGVARTAAQQAYDALALGYREYAVSRLAFAVEHESNPERRRQYAVDMGHLYVQLGVPRLALNAFQTANAIRADGDSLKSAGYTALAIGDNETAISAFSEAIALNPADAFLHRQLAYIHRTQGYIDKALHHFRHAIDLGGNEEDISHLRREARALENRIWGSATVSWRTKGGPPPEKLQFGDRTLSQSQGIWEGNIRLPLSLGAPDRWVAGFSRLLWSVDGANPLPASHSLQGGVGLKIKPFAGWNVILGAERLVAIGDFSRNDWLARASASMGGGFERPLDNSNRWLYWSAYGDIAAIGLDRPDLQASGEARLGAGMAMKSLIATPHLMLSGLWQDDIIGHSGLLEGGPGLSLTLPFGSTHYSAARYTVDLTLAYRMKLAGSSRNKDSLTISLRLGF